MSLYGSSCSCLHVIPAFYHYPDGLEETASGHRVKRQEYARENQWVLKEKARFTMKPVTAAQSAVNEILKN